VLSVVAWKAKRGERRSSEHAHVRRMPDDRLIGFQHSP
jgi:hypothetical protein